ncbi:EI24 domain-containing protein [Nocardioides sp. C4-1]|uniref:EI24 domain-containing protein n=1 Tax=Nocardioides sp. C4-1 TaxID=3151851 RepID=UPI0032651133
MVRDYLDGAAFLGRGWQLLRRRPGLFVLGMVPAFLVWLVLAGLFVLLVLNLGGVTAWLTPFADGWPDPLRDLLRWGLAIAVVVAAVLLWTATFTGITLTVGDPFYERVWRGAEDLLGPVELGDGFGFWESVRDGLKLMLVGLGIALLVLASGFVPVVGPVLALALGVALSGRMLARDLVENPLAARGFDKAAQARFLEPHRRRVHGFGMVCQACFLVPFGGVVMMPAAIAGATALVRDLLPDERAQAFVKQSRA